MEAKKNELTMDYPWTESVTSVCAPESHREGPDYAISDIMVDQSDDGVVITDMLSAENEDNHLHQIVVEWQHLDTMIETLQKYKMLYESESI